MTSMQQIEQLCKEARAHGMSYGEYIEKIKTKTAKPERTEYKEYEWFEGMGGRHSNPRKTVECTCQVCGKPFIAKSKLAKYCEECKRARRNELVRASYAKYQYQYQRPEKPERPQKRQRKQSVYYKNCIKCGVVFTAKGNNAKHCPACAKEAIKQQVRDYQKRRYRKIKAGLV